MQSKLIGMRELGKSWKFDQQIEKQTGWVCAGSRGEQQWGENFTERIWSLCMNCKWRKKIEKGPSIMSNGKFPIQVILFLPSFPQLLFHYGLGAFNPVYCGLGVKSRGVWMSRVGMISCCSRRFILERRQENVFESGVHLPYLRVLLLVVAANVEEFQRSVSISSKSVLFGNIHI